MNFHDNQINVGLYPREGRVPTGVATRGHAHVTNEAGYAQESLVFFNNRLLVGAGIRFDEFRYGLKDEIDPTASGVQWAGRWQGKGNVTFTPSHRMPLTFHANYGRGINSIDARGVIQRPDQPRMATTDFYKVSVDITRYLSMNGGMTKIANAFYKGGDHSVYVDSAPHFVAYVGQS